MNRYALELRTLTKHARTPWPQSPSFTNTQLSLALISATRARNVADCWMADWMAALMIGLDERRCAFSAGRLTAGAPGSAAALDRAVPRIVATAITAAAIRVRFAMTVPSSPTEAG